MRSVPPPTGNRGSATDCYVTAKVKITKKLVLGINVLALSVVGQWRDQRDHGPYPPMLVKHVYFYVVICLPPTQPNF